MIAFLDRLRRGARVTCLVIIIIMQKTSMAPKSSDNHSGASKQNQFVKSNKLKCSTRQHVNEMPGP